MEMDHTTQEFLRYLVVVVTIPLWLPFVKELWKELNRAMRCEGGLLGRLPTIREQRELDLEIQEEEDALVSEPLGGHSSPARRMSAPGRPHPARPTRGASGQRGFRAPGSGASAPSPSAGGGARRGRGGRSAPPRRGGGFR